MKKLIVNYRFYLERTKFVKYRFKEVFQFSVFDASGNEIFTNHHFIENAKKPYNVVCLKSKKDLFTFIDCLGKKDGEKVLKDFLNKFFCKEVNDA